MGFVIGHKKLLWEREYERPVASTKQKIYQVFLPPDGIQGKRDNSKVF